MATDDHARFLHALLTAVIDSDDLPRSRHAGRVLRTAAVEGEARSAAAVARTTSMLVAIVRDVLSALLTQV